MKRVMFVNTAAHARKLAGAPQGTVVCIPLGAAPDLFARVQEACGGVVISTDALISRLRREVLPQYIAYLAALNTINDSLRWWLLNFTGKSALSTEIYEKIFFAALARRVIRDVPQDTVVFVGDDIDVAHQVQDWSSALDIDVTVAIRRSRPFRAFLKERTPCLLVYQFLRSWRMQLISKALHRPTFHPNTGYTIISTIFSGQSFSSGPGYRDTYFGALVPYLRARGVPTLLMGIVFEPYGKTLRRVRAAVSDAQVTTVNAWARFGDLCASLAVCFFSRFASFSYDTQVSVEGMQPTLLVRNMVRRSFWGRECFINNDLYCAVRCMAHTVTLERVIYPFENRGWEKMLVLALRRYSPKTKIIGFQHSAITPRHTEYMFGVGERLPLPDIVCTQGEITRDILESNNVPPGLLRTGCDLRGQGPGISATRQKPGAIRRVLVILSTSQADYHRMVEFMQAACAGLPVHMIFRAHPEIPLSAELRARITAMPDGSISTEKMLEDAFSASDIVVYNSSTTVAVRAVASGLPVVFVDDRGIIDPDPLFGLQDMKWRIEDPRQFAEVITAIDALPGDEYAIRQERARAYTRRYFIPVTDDCMGKFID